MSVASEYMGAMLAGQQFQSGQLKQQQEKQQMDILQQEEPARLQTLQQDATLKQLQVNIAKRQDAASQAFADLVRKQATARSEGGATGAGVTGTGPTSPSDLLTEQADVLFQYGLGSDGVATLKDAADLTAKQATTAKTQAETHAVFLGDVAGWVDTPGMTKADITQQIATYYPQYLQDKQVQQVLQQSPDSPNQAQRDHISNVLRTQKDKLEADYKRAQITHETAETRASDARAKLDLANAGFDVVSEAAHTKAGDPPTEGPSLDAIRAAYLTTPGAVIPPGGLAQQNAFFRALRKENPGVTDAKALVQLTVGAGGHTQGGFGAAMNARFMQRVVAAATEGQAQLETISRLGSTAGVPTQGIFKGSIIGSSKTGSVSQLLTSTRQKEYNASLAGLAPELAAAQNQGLAPTGPQIDNIIQNLSIYPTDDAQTAQFKVALLARDFRKALEGGVDIMQPAQKTHAQELIDRLNNFPDPDVIANAKPGENIFPPGKFGARGVQPIGGGGRSPPRVTNDAGYNALPSGTQFIAPDGSLRRKP